MSNNTFLIFQVIIGFVTIAASVTSSAFIAGMRWGRVREEITSIDRRLAKIEGMFTLTFKDN